MVQLDTQDGQGGKHHTLETVPYCDTMAFGNGWNLTHNERRQLYVLEWLYDRASGKPNRYVKLDRSDIGLPHPEDADPAALLAEAVEHLYQERLVHYVVHTGPVSQVPPRVELTHTGIELIRAIRRQRTDPPVRRSASRDALLRWLYDCAQAGESPEINDFRRCDYAVFLSAYEIFTTIEINDASAWLRNHDYIVGETGFDNNIVRPKITPKGEDLVESDRSTSNEKESAGDTTITITGSTGVNVASKSPNANQASAVAITAEGQRQIHMLADYLEQVAGQLALGEEDTARIPELAAELRAIAQEVTPDRGRLRRLLDSARELAIAAAGVPLGAGLQALVHQVAQALGLS